MLHDELNTLYTTNWHKTASIGIDMLREIGYSSYHYTKLLTALAALAYKTRSTDLSTQIELQKHIDKSITDFATKGFLLGFVQEHWDMILKYSNSANMKELKAVALFFSNGKGGIFPTPDCLSLLAGHLLDITLSDTVLDLCAGDANASINLLRTTESSAITDVEISTDCIIVSNIRSWLLDNPINIKQENVLTMEHDYFKADKVFIHAPFGYRSEFDFSNSQYSMLLNSIPRVDRGDWGFIFSAILCQNDPGRTVAVTSAAPLFRDNRGVQAVREMLVKSGKLEAVITLPSGLYMPYTNVQTHLLVFSNDNTAVRMIDASALGTQSMRVTTLSENDVDSICQAMEEDSDNSKLISHKQLEANQFNLIPASYLHDISATIKNGVPLGKLALSIQRGSTLPSKELQALVSDAPTPYQYLMLQNIQDNRVQKDLPFLKEIDAKNEKFTVSTGDLLISRMPPFKIAVMPDMGKQKVLANGNLFYLHLDSEKIHPVYAMLFLNSNKGIEMLNAFAQGAALVSISRKSLEQVMIPMIPMKEQLELVEKYESLISELTTIEKQAALVRNRIASLMGGED